MKKKVQVFSLSLVIVIILAALLSTSVGAQSPNTYTSIILTDVLSGAPVVGGMFVTDLQVSITNSAPPVLGVLGVEIWVPFDSSVVTVSDFDDNPANGTQIEVKNGFFDGNLVIGANEVLGPNPAISHPPECDTRACVHIAVSHTGGSGPVTDKTGTVASITWAGIAPGPCNFSIASPGALPGSFLSTSSGGLIPVNSTYVPAITVSTAGTITGVVGRQGSLAGHANTDVVALTVSQSEAGWATTSAGGDFSLAVPVGSTYTINAWYPGYLHAQKSGVYVVGSTVSIGHTTLIGGDAKQDNSINILDIVLIISWFGQNSPPVPPEVDINDDGVVNILDLTIAAGNFGRYGPTTW